MDFKLGIDLNPVDINDRDPALWLRALVWPEDRERLSKLDAAMEIASEHPPNLVAGDALDLLPGVLDQSPPDSSLCVFHTHTACQMTPDNREALVKILDEYGSDRDFYYLLVEWFGEYPAVELATYHSGEKGTELLACCDAHGRWIEWLGQNNPAYRCTSP